jgi:hypothetical protein
METISQEAGGVDAAGFMDMVRHTYIETAGEDKGLLLGALVSYEQLAVQDDKAMHSLVGEARNHYISYQKIGRVLGASRQATWSRFKTDEPEANQRRKASAELEAECLEKIADKHRELKSHPIGIRAVAAVAHFWGATYDEMADALGVSRQAPQLRFSTSVHAAEPELHSLLTEQLVLGVLEALD